MNLLAGSQFGILIAYLIPGFTILLTASRHSSTISIWLGTFSPDPATVGGFLYVTLAAVAAGMIASTIRWLILDSMHHCTGICRPDFNFSDLHDKIDAFEYLVEVHYRFYQFYGNGLIAVLGCYADLRLSPGSPPWGLLDAATVVVSTVLLAGSRDTLERYYDRVGQLLRARPTGKAIARPIIDRACVSSRIASLRPRRGPKSR